MGRDIDGEGHGRRWGKIGEGHRWGGACVGMGRDTGGEGEGRT